MREFARFGVLVWSAFFQNPAKSTYEIPWVELEASLLRARIVHLFCVYELKLGSIFYFFGGASDREIGSEASLQGEI